MADQQKTQEKKAWRTPEIVVLTRDSDESAGVLRDCKGAGQDDWTRSNQTSYNNSCNKVMYNKCTNFCAQITMI